MTPFSANVDGNGEAFDGNKGRNEPVLLLELPLDWRTGSAWALRNLRLRGGDTSAPLSLNFLEADECIRETKAPLAVNMGDGKDLNCNFAIRKVIEEFQNDKFDW